MKHIVTVTTSNPAHEFISLRRRQSTTNYMVEARDEQEALLRASAHFKRLGHYIHEAKIFKKKAQLNELAPNYNPSAFIDDSAAKAGLKRNPGESDADLVNRISAAKGIHDPGIEPVFPELALLGGTTKLLGGAANVARKVVAQAGSAAFDKLMKSTKDVETGLGNLGTAIVDKGTSAGRIVRDELISHAVSLPVAIGLQAASNKSAGKETNLGSIVKDDQFWKDYAYTPGLSVVARPLRLTGDAGKYIKDVADDVTASAIKKAQTVGSAANDVVAAAINKAKNLTPGRIDLPTKTTERAPYTELEPAIAPQRITVKPETEVKTKVQPGLKPEVAPQVKPEVKTAPTIVVGRADAPSTAKPELQTKTETSPKTKPNTPVKGGGKPRVGKPRVGKPRPRPFVLPIRLGDRPDQDIGTLGQYRGMFPLYQFADFNSLRESQVKPMNAIGRVMTKRKEKNKEDAEAEKNKINMEPTLKSGKN